MIRANRCFSKNRELLKDILFIIAGIGIITFVVFMAKSIRSLDGDNCPQTYALFVDVARAIQNKEVSLWLPYIWGGCPNIGNFITEAFYPVNWILCNLFYDSNTTLVSYAIIPWNLIIHYSIYFIGFYYLVKKMGFSRLNAFATSITSTLCCSLFYYRTWIVYTDGFCYLPLIILFAILLYERRHKFFYSVVLAVLFAIEASISMSLMLVLSVLIFGMIFIAYIVGNNRKNALCNLGYSALTGILAILLVAPLLTSTLTYVENMVRFVPDVGFIRWGVKIPIEEYTKYKYTWNDFLHMIKFTNHDIGISVSVFVLLFCTIGLFSKEKRFKRLYYVALIGAIICGLASFGIIFPAAFYFIPGLNQLREAFMYGILLNLFASILAAFGFNSIEKIILEKRKWKEQLHFVILFGVILLSLLSYNALSHNVISNLFIILAVIVVLIALIKSTRLCQISFYICTFLFIGLCGIDLFQTINVYMYTNLEAIKQVQAVCENSRELIKYVHNLDPSDEYYRITDWGTVTSYPSNMASVLGFYDVVSYMNPTFSSGIDLHLLLSLEQRSQMQNIKYYLVSARDELPNIEMFEENPNFAKVGEIDHVYADYSGIEEGTVYIYQALCNLSDAWLVSDYHWNEINTKEEILTQIACNEVSIDKTAIIDACALTKLEQEHLNAMTMDSSVVKGSVVCKGISNNSIIYDVNTENSSILVTAELYYPGWRVCVNGKPQTILQVNGTNRGVIVPSGESTIEFYFRPIGYRSSIILQLLTIVIIISTGIRYYRKQQC